MPDTTLDYARALITRPSVTPEDQGCQQLIGSWLKPYGFSQEFINHGATVNSWLRRGTQEPLLAFAGHTDVVPAGDETWEHAPFSAKVKRGVLYGRGAADMKGSLAAIVRALIDFVECNPNHKGSLALLLTSDEEGPATEGTVKVVEKLLARKEKITWCVVGEPSSRKKLGDQIRVGRRGSLHCHLSIQGVAGHIAYPELALNPIHSAAPFLAAMTREIWDKGNAFFPPTSMQIYHIDAGGKTTNVIPQLLGVSFNFRYSTAVDAQILRTRVEALLKLHNCNYSCEWVLSGLPFLTAKGPLLEATVDAIQELQGYKPILSTGGGTSDGRFIAPMGAEVIELGPVNSTIHKVNECVSCQELDGLYALYKKIITTLLG